MKLCHSLLPSLTATLITIQHVNGQPVNDSSGRGVVKQFSQDIGENAFIYNGTEYINADPLLKGDPFFLGNETWNGTLVYNNVAYSNVRLLYDTWNDVVITQRYNNGVLMNLISEKIKAFTLGNHSFIRLIKDDNGNASLTTGFYELFYDGSTQVIAKHRKRIDKANTVETGFVESTHYFLRKNGKYFAVKNKRELLRLLHDKTDVIKKFLKANGLNYKQQPEETLARVAALYDQVSK